MKEKKKKSKKSIEYWLFILVVLIPPLIMLFFNWIVCGIAGFVQAFTDASTGKFTLENFRFFFDGLFRGELRLALRNTLLFYLLNTVIILPLSYLIAFFIYKRIVGYKFFRFVFFLPAILPGVAVTTAYKEIIKNESVLGMLCDKIGVELPELGLLGTESTAIWAVIAYTFIFTVTGGFMVTVGTMSRIPDSVFEAAKLDGCPPWIEFTKIVVPLMLPLIMLNLLTGVVGFFGASGPLLLLTNGEAGTMTVSYWITKKILFEGSSAYNMAAAANLSLAIMILPVALLVRRWMVKLPAVEF